MTHEGLVAFQPNPQHKRAQLVVFTDRGRILYERALWLQRPWAAELAHGLTGQQVAAACDVLGTLLERLDIGGTRLMMGPAHPA
ncbi:hypothetical protein [Sphingomonas sp.]|uniref:hypothetical protein n=1 Tax=Sphingomonas sp. TaxID=28214 RepID=UPI0025E57C6F|nr:hypothetical protein [Sphingomonas sp.]MBV9529079.1 hypothetical protein [Sphingomonas sp.]